MEFDGIASSGANQADCGYAFSLCIIQFELLFRPSVHACVCVCVLAVAGVDFDYVTQLYRCELH